jgi:hypothetical protein
MTDAHPDDEALSAYLDGEEPHLRDHIDGCAACVQRLDEFRRIRAAIATPVAEVAARQRDAAIATALAASAGKSTEPWYRRIAGRTAGIAAALLLIIGAAFALTQLVDSGGSKKFESVGGKISADQGGVPEAAPAPESVGDLGDLGELANSAALRAIVEPKAAEFSMLARRAGTTQESATAPAPPAGVADAAQDLERQKRIALDCAGTTQALDPANVGPTYAGTATWQGVPASVLVYAVQGQQDAVHVYVVAQSDCHVLEFQSYRP